MYCAKEIASWFISRNDFDCDMSYTDTKLSNLKLQELLYYAQGCTLAMTGERLFSDKIRWFEIQPETNALQKVPYVPEIYFLYKECETNGTDPENAFPSTLIDESTQKILETVYQNFGQFAEWKLRKMTTSELNQIDKWLVSIVKDAIGIQSENAENVIVFKGIDSHIPTQFMKEYFEKHYLE